MKLTNPSTIKSLCAEYGFSLKKKFGQNFLINEDILEKITQTVSGKRVLEIGPGIGTMTRALSAVCEKVVAVEIDRSLSPLLECTTGDLDNVKIVYSDVMKINLTDFCTAEFGDGEIAVCANLPYYITTPIILALLECGAKLSSVTIMVQKEVADRLCAEAGTAQYGAITLACRRRGRVKKLFSVSRTCFYPAPNVDSAVISIIPAEREKYDVNDEKFLSKLIRAAFNQRRKTFVNAVNAEFPEYSKERLSGILEDLGFRKDIRGERLSLLDFVKIVNSM